MGQQQLLLVILVVIIVGITTIIAVNIMGQGADNANRDAVRQDLISAATKIQPLWERPTIMRGADRDFNNLEIPQIVEHLNIPSSSYEVGDETVTNENGIYSVEIESATSLKITGEPLSGGTNLEITVTRQDETSNWTFEISETSPDSD